MKKMIPKIILIISLLYCTTFGSFINVEEEIAGSINPLGLRSKTIFTYNKNLFPNDSNILWKNSKISMGICNILSPAFEAIGPYIKIEPIAFFNIQFEGYVKNSFNALGFGFYDNLSSYDDEYSDDKIVESVETTYYYRITPQLQFQYKSFIATSNVSISRFIREKEAFYYDRQIDFAIDNDEYILANSSWLLYEINDTYITGCSRDYSWNRESEIINHRVNANVIYHKESDSGSTLFLVGVGTHFQSKYYKRKFNLIVAYSKSWNWDL